MTISEKTLTRRGFLAYTAAAASLAQFPASHNAEAASPPAGTTRKPDILFLLADDYAFDLVHALGCNEIQTPNLDRLVHRGTSFTNCYNQGGWHGAVCVASRTMLMTGLFLWKAQAAGPRLRQLCSEKRLWPHYLSDAGYRTYLSGKWHVSCPPGEVFQLTANVRPGMPPDIPAQYNRPLSGQQDPFNPADPSPGGYFTDGRHWSEVVADDGIHFLQDAVTREEPFFLYLAFNAPHDPRQSPQSFLDLYDPQAIPLPRNFLPEYPMKDAIGCGQNLRDERLAPFPRTEAAIRTHRREYFAAISHLDAQIGRVLDALERSGRQDNTVIIFTADNGLAAGHHGLMGKQNMFEHSMKVPLLIAGPGMPSDKRRQDLVYMQDVMPTTLELAGVSVPAHISFRTLLPLIRETDVTGYEAIYGAYMNLQRMVRVDRHKLIFYPKINQYLLFDLDADPDETRNLSEEPALAPKLQELRNALAHLQQATGDPLVFS